MNEGESRLVDILRQRIESSDDMQSADDSALQEAVEALFASVGLRLPLSRVTGRGTVTKVVGFFDEAHWLLGAMRDTGPEEAVRRLREFASANGSAYEEIVAFWGMHPARLIEVAEGIRLGPLDALRPSDPRDYFLGLSVAEERRVETDHATQFPKPRAVLVKHIPVKPLYFGPTDPRPTFTYEDKYFLTELMQMIPVVIKSPVIPVAQWIDWPSDEPVVSRGGYGWSQHARATWELPKTEYDEESVESAVRGFLALEPESRNRLRLPLRRLNAFLLTESFADRAIEAGVTMEALLSQPGDAKEGMTSRLAIRAALLTQPDLATREDMVRRVKDLYALRSIAAHGADLDEFILERPPWGVTGKFKRREEVQRVLGDVPELVASVVGAILSIGAFPDYASLDLSPGSHHTRSASP